MAPAWLFFMKSCPMVDNPSGKYGELRNVYTKPAYRRKGISEKLVGMALEKAKERGVAKSVCLHRRWSAFVSETWFCTRRKIYGKRFMIDFLS